MITEHWYWTPPGGTQTDLNTAYWNVTTFGGTRMALPTMRGQDIEVPYRAGQSWRPKYPNSRTITLLMWTAGIDQSTGQPAADQLLAFNNNLQQLRSMFFVRRASGSAQGQLTRNWYLGSGAMVTATAMAEVAGSMEPTMTGRFRADFPVDLLLSDPYFYGAQVTAAITTSGTVTNAGDAEAGEGYSSAVSNYTIALSAAATVTNTTNSTSVTYTAQGGETFPVTLDILNETATDNGGASVSAGVTHAGSRIWLPLDPGANSITVSAGTATVKFTPGYI